MTRSLRADDPSALDRLRMCPALCIHDINLLEVTRGRALGVKGQPREPGVDGQVDRLATRENGGEAAQPYATGG